MPYTTLVNGVHLITDGDMVVNSFNRNGEFEPNTWLAWVKHIREDPQGGGAVDIGAYTGLYAIGARRYAEHVYAFEPFAPVFDRLQQNIELNRLGHVKAFPSAVLEKTTTVQLKQSNATPLTSASRVVTPQKGGEHIWAVCLDDFLPKELRWSALKFDCEGSEPRAITGALEIIARDNPLVIAEVLDDVAEKKVRNLMPECYTCEKMDGRNLVFTPKS